MKFSEVVFLESRAGIQFVSTKLQSVGADASPNARAGNHNRKRLEASLDSSMKRRTATTRRAVFVQPPVGFRRTDENDCTMNHLETSRLSAQMPT
jgi:hypothetical protein